MKSIDYKTIKEEIDTPVNNFFILNDNGLLHNETGPAAVEADGSKYWFINGAQIDCKTQKEFERLMKIKAIL